MATDTFAETIQAINTTLAVPGQQSLCQQSETQTRYALIDPLLQALGWKLEQPARCGPSSPSKKARRRITRCACRERPVVLGEAKSLHTKDLTPARDQGWDYCRASAVRYLFASDGQRWEIYDTYRKQTQDDARVARFDVVRDPIEDYCAARAVVTQNVVATRAATTTLHRGNGIRRPNPDQQKSSFPTLRRSRLRRGKRS